MAQGWSMMRRCGHDVQKDSQNNIESATPSQRMI